MVQRGRTQRLGEELFVRAEGLDGKSRCKRNSVIFLKFKIPSTPICVFPAFMMLKLLTPTILILQSSSSGVFGAKQWNSKAPTVFLFFLLNLLLFSLLYSAFGVSIEPIAHRTVQSKAVKFGTLVEGHAKRLWFRFDIIGQRRAL